MNILHHIPIGEGNAISRSELRQRTGLADRLNRREIQAARIKGVRIISSSGGRGYWIATTDAEWIRFEREQVHRAKELLRQFGGKYRIIGTDRSQAVEMEGQLALSPAKTDL